MKRLVYFLLVLVSVNGYGLTFNGLCKEFMPQQLMIQIPHFERNGLCIINLDGNTPAEQDRIIKEMEEFKNSRTDRINDILLRHDNAEPEVIMDTHAERTFKPVAPETL